MCVGKLKPFFRDGCSEYLKRLKSTYDITVCEIPEQPTIKKECDEILKRAGGYVALLDVNGEQVTSESFAAMLRFEHERRDEITFVIGGAEGVDERVRSSATKLVSFGRVTYSHQLARLLLFEQLYRAMTIIKGVPYHK